MRVPFEWLKDFIDFTAAPEEIADKLTMIGLEVEAIEPSKDDVVFEVNVTPNRPDCLSIIGIARELSATFNIPLKIPLCEINGESPFSDFSVEILNPELCNRYAGRVIKGVNIYDSPEWIRVRLEKCGVRSINNIVDITNYVLLEFGHPLHAFDLDEITGDKIKVGVAGPGNKIVTLDGAERNLPEDSLLIWDSVRPIAIAGVMGGLDTEVTDNTKNIFLESAYFNPLSIRRTAKRLNLISESSYRFERGTDIEFLERALNRAALMIREIAGGMVHEIIDEYPIKYFPEPIEARYDRINKILGTELSNITIYEILKRLGIKVEDKEDSMVVNPPAYRRDMKNDNDIAEEIARLYGYDRIPRRIPRSPLPSGQPAKKMTNIFRIRETMRKAGFTEIINYSFMNPLSLDTINIPGDDRRRKVIVISNPLRQEESLLRTTLVPSLIENFKYNLDRGIKEIRFFEMAKVFEDIGEPLPLEEFRLGGVFYKEKTPSLWREDASGFFITKGALESIFEELKIKEYSFSSSSEPFLHKGQAADIFVSGSYAGFLGLLGPEIVERLDLKKHKPEIILFELNLDLLLTLIPDSIKYCPTPRYPSVERDIAIVVDDFIPAFEIKKIIESFPTELIEEVSVFDYYKGGNIPDGKKSLAFSVIYRSREKTLTDEEVEKLHTSLVKYVLKKTGGKLRT
ncbi:MAG: phenylalanine--tRNA ligase subunit beta [Nitrospirota bacterium]